MGLDYDKAIDLWSVAVTLFELYKGSPVLPGVNNNEVRGPCIPVTKNRKQNQVTETIFSKGDLRIYRFGFVWRFSSLNGLPPALHVSLSYLIPFHSVPSISA